MKIKKRIGIFAVFVLSILALAGCGKEVKLNPGTYEGVGKGYNAQQEIRLSVTIAEDGKIYDIKVLSSAETEHIGERALNQLIATVKEENKTEIDNISGATRTTEGFREALNDALQKAAQK